MIIQQFLIITQNIILPHFFSIGKALICTSAYNDSAIIIAAMYILDNFQAKSYFFSRVLLNLLLNQLLWYCLD